MYKQFGISDELLELSKKVELEVQEQFKKIEDVWEFHSLNWQINGSTGILTL